MSARFEALARVPLFGGLAPAELESVAAGTREVQIDVGTELMRQGEPGSEFFVITAGALEIQIGGRAVNILGPGDFLGELALLFGAPRIATAVALEATTLLVMGKEGFTALLAEHPAVESKLLAVVAQRMRYR